MKRIRTTAFILALCLLPLTAQAWWPPEDSVYGTREELPAGVQALLPEALTLRYAYGIGDMFYAWTADAQGNYVALVFAQQNGGCALLAQSAPLSAWNGLSPSLGYSGNGFFSIDYSDSYTFTFRAGADGRWALRAAYSYSVDLDCFMTFYPHAAVEYRSDRYDLRRVYGSWTRSLTLDTLDVSVFPRTFDDVLAMLDTQGWAMVQSADPVMPAPLYAAPDAQSECLGQYYTGAPAEVLESAAEWRRVRIGGAEGWMPEKALVFGEDMRDVTPGFPDLVLTEDAYGAKDILYASPSADGVPAPAANLDETQTRDAADGLFIIGIVDGQWYHVLSWNGDTGYIEIKWFYPGNG